MPCCSSSFTVYICIAFYICICGELKLFFPYQVGKTAPSDPLLCCRVAELIGKSLPIGWTVSSNWLDDFAQLVGRFPPIGWNIAHIFWKFAYNLFAINFNLFLPFFSPICSALFPPHVCDIWENIIGEKGKRAASENICI